MSVFFFIVNDFLLWFVIVIEKQSIYPLIYRSPQRTQIANTQKLKLNEGNEYIFQEVFALPPKKVLTLKEMSMLLFLNKCFQKCFPFIYGRPFS